MLFKMNRLKITFLVICLCVLTSIPVSSNPLPIYVLSVEEGSNPVPDTDTPLILVSEEVEFYISDKVDITGRYTIQNPTNDTINQTIYFPFYKQYYYNLGEFIYGDNSSYSITSVQFNNTYVPYFNSNYNGQPAISFELTVLPNSSDNITIIYETYYGITYNTKCELIYITTTGKAWSGSISHAKFNFNFNNNYLDGDPWGLDNYTISKHATVGYIERFDWTPMENIILTWNTTTGLFNSPYYDPYYSIELGPIIDEKSRPLKNVKVSLQSLDNNIPLLLDDGTIVFIAYTDEQGCVNFRLERYNLHDQIKIVAEKEGFNSLIKESITIYHNTSILENERLTPTDDNDSSMFFSIFDMFSGLPLYMIFGIITVVIIVIVMIILRKRK